MMHQSMRGVGAYPSDTYYDPNRPSWLPYWIDDATESAQKYGMFGNANVNTVYPNPPAPIPPIVQPDLTGRTVDINTQVAQTAAANAAQTQSFFNQLAATLPNSPEATASSTGLSTAAIVAIAVVGVMLLAKK